MIDSEDTPRRQFLRVAVKLLAAALFVAFAAVFLSGLFGGGQKTATPQRVDVRDLPIGQVRQVRWNGRPYLIVHRGEALLRRLARPNPRLLDPAPADARAWLVVSAIGPALGCPLHWVGHNAPQAPGTDWPGGFTEACGGVWYDGAGRVLRQPRAIRNLDIPPYRVDPDGFIELGVGP